MDKDVDVDYDGDASSNCLTLRHESGIRVEIEANDKSLFRRLHREIFADPGTLAGAAYQAVLDMETGSGMTVAEVIEAARCRSDVQN